MRLKLWKYGRTKIPRRLSENSVTAPALYKISEIFYSVQGEGKYVGVPAAFIRLAGCSARCVWCDSKYARKTKRLMSDAQILAEIKKYPSKIVIITGGEPTEQNLAPLLKTLHQSGRQIHLETNGSIDINTDLIYCLTVSPKKTASGALLKKADVIKLVLDDKLTEKEIRKYFKYKALVYLQPEGNKTENVRKCLKIIKANPRLRLSLQIHKLIGVR